MMGILYVFFIITQRRKDMIYAYAKITVTNPEALVEYRDVAGAALAKHGGKVESAAGDFTVLDGAPEMPNVAALLSFPDKDAAIAWANDPEIADVHALRRSAGASDILLLG
tara:strand:- start:1520 stop:1852 length:333 start_codon:yes stop_codon:yes gene_type:complete